MSNNLEFNKKKLKIKYTKKIINRGKNRLNDSQSKGIAMNSTIESSKDLDQNSDKSEENKSDFNENYKIKIIKKIIKKKKNK